MAGYIALFDACVLYPYQLRDLLLHLARTDLFMARWTEKIHEEWIAAVVRNGGDAAKLAITRQRMNAAVPDCLVTDYEHLIESLDLPDPKDRHVLAAAIACHANVIVTTNLRHFPPDKLAVHEIEVQHPDDFIICQLDLDEPAVIASIARQRAALRRPPMNVTEFLDSLSRVQLPKTVERLRQFSSQL